MPTLTPRVLVCLFAASLMAAQARGACGNGVVEAGEDCDDGSENGGTNSCCTSSCTFTGRSPDVIVGNIGTVNNYGTVSGITAYSFSTTSCNLGSCWLNWFQDTTEHPVIAENMFRLKNGRLEQIGQAWVKHTYAALTGSVCATCDPPPDTTHLGVNCSDPYSANTNGTQTNLGPKNNVNANTGVFQYPDSRLTNTGNAIYKRLQVHNTDLDPASNAGALYFLEAQYITHDDAAAGHQTNNASYRRVTVGSSPFNLTLQDTAQQQKAGIQAWKANDAAVTETQISAPEGRFILAAEATALGGGVYHYEYAVQNLTNQRAGQSFSVPLPAGAVVTNVGFHDVDYHSSVAAELYDGTDWTPTVSAGSVSWATQTYATNQNANALRWGTLYNFRFDANVAPDTGNVTIGLFRPGSPTTVTAATVVPGPCAGTPAEVGDGLTVGKSGTTATIAWDPAAGSTSYDVVRGDIAALPVGPGGGDETCLGSGLAQTSTTDATALAPGDGFWYLARGASSCGKGPYGSQLVDGASTPRTTTTCP